VLRDLPAAKKRKTKFIAIKPSVERDVGLSDIWTVRAGTFMEPLPAICRGLKACTGWSGTLIEQNARMALRLAHEAYILELGRVTIHGKAKDLIHNEDVRKAYLGSG